MTHHKHLHEAYELEQFNKVEDIKDLKERPPSRTVFLFASHLEHLANFASQLASKVKLPRLSASQVASDLAPQSTFQSEPQSQSVSQVASELAQLATQLEQLLPKLTPQPVSQVASDLENVAFQLASYLIQLARLASQLAQLETQLAQLAFQLARLASHLAQLASDLMPQSPTELSKLKQLASDLAQLASDLVPQSVSQSEPLAPSNSEPPAPSDSEPPAPSDSELPAPSDSESPVIPDLASQLAELVAHLAKQLTEIESQSSRSHRALKCKVGILVALVLFLAASQPTMLLVLTYALPQSCEINSNSSDCAEVAAESDNKSIYFQVIDLLRIIFSFMTFPEYAVLVHGVYKLLVKTSNAMHPSLHHPSLEPRKYLRKMFTKLCEERQRHYKAWLGIFIALIFILVFALTSQPPPAMGIAHAFIKNKCYSDCEEQQMVLIIRVIYDILHYILHTLSPIIVGSMVITVLEVRAIWFHIDMDEKTKPDTIDKIHKSSEDEMKAIIEHYKCVNDYMQRIRKIHQLLRVFQTWFVFQWFHYFFQSITDLTQTLHQWITGTQHPELHLAYRGIHTAYDILAFAIPHVCGLKINAYHEQYLRHERKKLLKAAQSKRGYAKAYSLQIEKIKYGDFVPRIRATGIKIPLDSTGYTLTILLSIFALSSSFINFSWK